MDVVHHWSDLAACVFAPVPSCSPTRRVWQGSGVYRCGACAPDHNGVLPPVNATKSRQGINIYRCSVGGHNRRYQQVLDDYVDSLIVDRLTASTGRELIDDRTVARICALFDHRARLRPDIESKAVRSMIGTARIGTGSIASNDPQAVQRAAVVIDALEADFVSAVRRDPVTVVLCAGIQVERLWATMDPQWRARIIDSLMTVVILPLDHRQTRELDTERIAIHWRR